MEIASLVRHHHLPLKSLLANTCYPLFQPSQRLLGHLHSPFISSNLSILQSATSLSHQIGISAIVANDPLEDDKVKVLKQKLELHQINCDDSCLPGFFSHVFCPKCEGGKSMERSLSLHIVQNGDFAMWRCFHNSCGWAGQVFADGRETNQGIDEDFKVVSFSQMTTEPPKLEPLGQQLLAYFADRMISEETLTRNAVMQIAGGEQDTIAFTYIHNGIQVGCKYRTMDRRFWQDKGTAKQLYGLDDIKEASEIIIVEGEIDKLSVEEAGFRNCASVPNGAPLRVSEKKLPPLHNPGQSISVSVE